MSEILQYVKQRGECLDTEIAAATKIPLVAVHLQFSELASKYQGILCDSIRFVKGKETRQQYAGFLDIFHLPSRVRSRRYK